MKLTRLLLALLLTLTLLSACKTGPTAPPSDQWGQDAVFYEIFVRSFADSNGDGIGDFNGITQKLDYLNDGDPATTGDLGITALWLMPIFPSPSYHGYDVTDYKTVNPQYGTLDDFKTLLSEAHKRGIKVTIDYVINHTSDQHPWFKASASGDPRYRDYYIWSADNPGYTGPWGEEVWHPLNGSFYYGVFTKEMPDLNYTNSTVSGQMDLVTDFWLNKVGVDGFRIDGAKHLIEDGKAQENTAKTHEWMKGFHDFYKAVAPGKVVTGEVWSPMEQAAKYVNDGELDMVFNFPLAEDILGGVGSASAERISRAFSQSSKAFHPGRYASFLTNHDQNRTMTQLGGDINRAKAAATLLLTSPGTPYIYYGEEIGMTGGKPDPDIRSVMQWTAGANAGFSSAAPWQPAHADYVTVNVQAQDGDPASLLSHYRQLIRIRGAHPALRSDQYTPVDAGSERLFAMLRPGEQESVLVLVNLGSEAIAAPALKWDSSPLRGTYKAVMLLGQGDPAALTVNAQGGATGFQPLAEIPAHASLIIQLTH